MSSPGCSHPLWGCRAAAVGGPHECGSDGGKGFQSVHFWTSDAPKAAHGASTLPSLFLAQAGCGRTNITDPYVTFPKGLHSSCPERDFPPVFCDSIWIPLQAPLLLPPGRKHQVDLMPQISWGKSQGWGRDPFGGGAIPRVPAHYKADALHCTTAWASLRGC